MTDYADVVAVVNTNEALTAIWHVDIQPATALSRLCGAWVTSDNNVVRNVVAARLILPVGGCLPNALTDLVAISAGVVDVTATLEAISARINELDAAHRASKTDTGQRRAPITWPTLPLALDWAAPPAPPAGVVDDPFVSATIGLARWVADLAEVWEAVEITRLSRKHLVGNERTALPLPVACIEATPA
jgi:hypothetical protein